MNKFRVFVRDHPIIEPSTFISDTFTRTIANDWGRTETGQAWTRVGALASDYSVSGGLARHTVTSITSRVSVAPSPAPHVNIYATIATDATPVGGSQFGYLLGRYTDFNNNYAARVEFTTSGAVALTLRKRIAGAETQLTGGTVSDLTYAPGRRFAVRFQVRYSTLRAKLWLASDPEPNSFNFSITDTGLTEAGSIGFRTAVASTNTNSTFNVTYDDLDVRDPWSSRYGSMPLIGEIDSYTEFSCTPRVNDVGSWSLKIPAGHEQADLLRPGRGIVVFLENNAEPVFSGPIRRFDLEWNKDEAGSGALVATGPCDNILFDERVGRATPDEGLSFEGDNLDFTTNIPTLDYIPRVFDGTVSRKPQNSAEFIWSLIQDNYLNYNTFGVQDGSRQIQYIGIPFKVPANLTAVSDDDIWKGFPIRMSSIRETVFAIAEAAGLNIRLMWMPDQPDELDQDGARRQTIFLQIKPVQDKSDTVVFGEQAGNLNSYKVTSVAPKATRVIIGGETSTGLRRYYHYSKNELFDPAGWKNADDVDSFGNVLDPEDYSDPLWGRTEIETAWAVTAEQFVDARDANWPYQPGFTFHGSLPPKPGGDVAQQFDQEALKNLIDQGPQGLFQLDVVDTLSTQFGVDYSVGDVVRALVDTRVLPSSMVPEDGVLTEQVREVTLSSEASEMWAIKPVVGTADSSPIPWVYKELKRLRAKVDSNARREELDTLSQLLPFPPQIISSTSDGAGLATTHRPTSGQDYEVEIQLPNSNFSAPGLVVDVDIDAIDLQISNDGYSWTSVESSLVQKDSGDNRWFFVSGGFTGVNSNRYWRARVNKQGSVSDWSGMVKFTIANGALNAGGTLTLDAPVSDVYKPGTVLMLTGTDTTYGDLIPQVFNETLGQWVQAGDVGDLNIIYTGTTYQVPYVMDTESVLLRMSSTQNNGSSILKTSNQVIVSPAL